MRTPAQAASENAISLEVKKDGLQQRQNGDWMLRFTVAEMHPQIAAAAMGARYQMVLVEIDDNEEAVDHQAMERDKWRSLGATKQAAIRCGDPVFWAWLTEEGYRGEKYDCDNSEDAAVIVRILCDVTSRADLGKPAFSAHRIKWYEIDGAFQAWRLKEAHGGG